MLLLIVLGIQSGQPYWVCQNIFLVDKEMAEYQYQLKDMRQYWVQLGWVKRVSMVYLKAGFHNILFEYASSYESTFVTHWRNF